MRYTTLPSLLLTVASLGAQDLIEPLVVTASRDEQPKNDAPYQVDIVTQEHFEKLDIRTLPDALTLVPGVLVQKTTHGHGSPFIRGFTGRQNLLMVDGVRLNNSTWRSGPVQYWNTVDPFSISHFELVKSQGSVLYGSDAAGGTLNAFTRSAKHKEREQDRFFQHGSAYYEFRSSGQGSHIGHLESDIGVGGKWGLHLGISAKDYGDIEDDAVGRMRDTGYPEQDIDARFDITLSEQLSLTAAFQNVNQDDVSRWHRTKSNPGWTHDGHVVAPGKFLYELYDQERSFAYVRLDGKNDQADAPVRRWHATLSWQKSQDSTNQLRSLTDQRTGVIDLDTWGLDIGAESQIGPGTLVYGFDWYHDSVDTGATRNGVFRASDRPAADGSTYDLLGAYSQYEWRPIEPLTLSGGLRYTHAKADWDAYRAPDATADASGDGSWDDLSASLRAVWHMSREWSLYGGVSQAFRAPNLNDLTGNTVSLAGLDSHGSPDLDPEQYVTAEMGARYGTEDLSMSLAGFYTWNRKSIISEKVGSDTYATNGGKGWVYGFEAEAAWKIDPQWTLTAMAAWNEGKSDTPTDGERWLTRQLPFSGSVALRWTHPSDRCWVEGRVIGAATEDRVHPDDQVADNQRIPTNGTPGYLAASLYAGYKVCANLELNGGVFNLFDADYRYHGSGQNEPGLHGVIGVKALW